MQVSKRASTMLLTTAIVCRSGLPEWPPLGAHKRACTAATSSCRVDSSIGRGGRVWMRRCGGSRSSLATSPCASDAITHHRRTHACHRSQRDPHLGSRKGPSKDRPGHALFNERQQLWIRIEDRAKRRVWQAGTTEGQSRQARTPRSLLDSDRLLARGPGNQDPLW